MSSIANMQAHASVAPTPVRSSVMDDLGRTASAVALARESAGLLGVSVEETWCSLYNLPLNMAGLLDSPQGWSVLAGYIADDLGLAGVGYWPEVH